MTIDPGYARIKKLLNSAMVEAAAAEHAVLSETPLPLEFQSLILGIIINESSHSSMSGACGFDPISTL
jgi:hypothetical protein